MTIKEKLVPTVEERKLVLRAGSTVGDIPNWPLKDGGALRDGPGVWMTLEKQGLPKRRFLIEATELEMRLLERVMAGIGWWELDKFAIKCPNLVAVVKREQTHLKLSTVLTSALGSTVNRPTDIVDSDAVSKRPMRVGARVRVTGFVNGSGPYRGPRPGMLGYVRAHAGHSLPDGSPLWLVEYDNLFDGGHTFRLSFLGGAGWKTSESALEVIG